MDQGWTQGNRMTRNLSLTLALVLAAVPCAAYAQDLQWHGYADARLQWSDARDRSWTDGGLGKTRFSDGDPMLVTSGALSGSWQVSRSWAAVLELQANPQTSPKLGVLDAYLRYRPVSTTRWRWSARFGAFFPPISLENGGVGWTSLWTLTPSAINTWVGEEFRSFGAELRVERRGRYGTLDMGVAAFQHNDPAGELLAARGWALGDVTSVIASHLREPDVYAPFTDAPPPAQFQPFRESDGRTGWHADLSWQGPGGARATVLRYDNRANPESSYLQGEREVYSWHTRFWSAGAEVPLGQFVLIGQWMKGNTAFEPAPGFVLDTRMKSWFALAGWGHGRWRPAIRFDHFQTRQLPDFLSAPLSEQGHAWTAALNWRPRDDLRITAEWLRIDSRRSQRVPEGLLPRQVEQQLQLSLRWIF